MRAGLRATLLLSISALLLAFGVSACAPLPTAPVAEAHVRDTSADAVPHPDGPARVTRETFTDSLGDSSDVVVAVPRGDDRTRPHGVILVFPGDGAGELDPSGDPGFLAGGDGIIAQGTARGYLVVALRTPDHEADTWWGERGAENAQYVHEFLGALDRERPVDRRDVWLVGYSGGAQFVTQNYLPAYADDLEGGGAVLFGGGGAPTDEVDAFPTALHEDFPMFWYAGQDDLGVPDADPYSGLEEAEAGSAWYADAGFGTDASFPEGIGHDLTGRFGIVLGERLDAAAD